MQKELADYNLFTTYTRLYNEPDAFNVFKSHCYHVGEIGGVNIYALKTECNNEQYVKNVFPILCEYDNSKMILNNYVQSDTWNDIISYCS